MSLFAEYNSTYSIPPPKPDLNGGLYTGEPFKKDAPWGNFPAVPDAGYMIHYNLRSANPPLEALYQYPGGIRPGNNSQTMPGIVKYNETYNLYAIDLPCYARNKPCNCTRCKFSKYAHL